MKAAYLKAPNQFEIRDVELREPMEDEVILEVKACGFCGHDKILAAYAAEEGAALKAAAAGCVTDVVKPDETKAKLMAMLEWLAGKRVSRLPKKHSNIPL